MKITKKTQIKIFVIIWTIISILMLCSAVILLPIYRDSKYLIYCIIIPLGFWFLFLLPLNPYRRYMTVHNKKLQVLDNRWEKAFRKRDWKYFLKQYLIAWLVVIVAMGIFLLIEKFK